MKKQTIAIALLMFGNIGISYADIPSSRESLEELSFQSHICAKPNYLLQVAPEQCTTESIPFSKQLRRQVTKGAGYSLWGIGEIFDKASYAAALGSGIAAWSGSFLGAGGSVLDECLGEPLWYGGKYLAGKGVKLMDDTSSQEPKPKESLFQRFKTHIRNGIGVTTVCLGGSGLLVGELSVLTGKVAKGIGSICKDHFSPAFEKMRDGLKNFGHRCSRFGKSLISELSINV